MQQVNQLAHCHQTNAIFNPNILVKQCVLPNNYDLFVHEMHSKIMIRLLMSYFNNPTLLVFHNQPVNNPNGLSHFEENSQEKQQNYSLRILQAKNSQNNCKIEEKQIYSSDIRFNQRNKQHDFLSFTEKNKINNYLLNKQESILFQKPPINIFPIIQENKQSHWLENSLNSTILLQKNIQNSSFKIYKKEETSKSQINNSKNNQVNKQTQETMMNQLLQSQVLKISALPKSEKTTNIPKFLLKIFLNFYQTDCKDLPVKADNLQKVKNYFTKLKNRKKNMNVRALKHLLSRNQISKSVPGQTRKLMFHILNKRKKQEIISNKKIIMKKFYLLSSKIYRIRCQSSALVQRLSIR